MPINTRSNPAQPLGSNMVAQCQHRQRQEGPTAPSRATPTGSGRYEPPHLRHPGHESAPSRAAASLAEPRAPSAPTPQPSITIAHLSTLRATHTVDGTDVDRASACSVDHWEQRAGDDVRSIISDLTGDVKPPAPAHPPIQVPPPPAAPPPGPIGLSSEQGELTVAERRLAEVRQIIRDDRYSFLRGYAKYPKAQLFIAAYCEDSSVATTFVDDALGLLFDHLDSLGRERCARIRVYRLRELERDCMATCHTTVDSPPASPPSAPLRRHRAHACTRACWQAARGLRGERQGFRE